MESYGPVLSQIVEKLDEKSIFANDEFWNHVWFTCLTSGNSTLHRVAIPLPTIQGTHESLMAKLEANEGITPRLLARLQIRDNQSLDDERQIYDRRVRGLLDLRAMA
ncbi:hypothetical protein HJFPF1_02747 [Paramyrothecium foliicola]|nr:hypothetical protein HJFPF1_02747 [Paramyrothecium foliicola]